MLKKKKIGKKIEVSSAHILICFPPWKKKIKISLDAVHKLMMNILEQGSKLIREIINSQKRSDTIDKY